MLFRSLIMTGVSVMASLAACVVLAQEPDPAYSQPKAIAADSLEEAEENSFGTEPQADAGGYTSHFNFDNRNGTSNKYHCILEYRLRNGGPYYYTNRELRQVSAGNLKELDLSSLRVQVVSCRFWWKLQPAGAWFKSEWVRPGDDAYIIYAYMQWTGHNDYERPIYFYAGGINESGNIPMLNESAYSQAEHKLDRLTGSSANGQYHPEAAQEEHERGSGKPNSEESESNIYVRNRSYSAINVFVVGPDGGIGRLYRLGGGRSARFTNCQPGEYAVIAYSVTTGHLQHLGKTTPSSAVYDILPNRSSESSDAMEASY